MITQLCHNPPDPISTEDYHGKFSRSSSVGQFMVHSGASQKKNKQTVIILLIYDLKGSLVIMSI